MMKKEVYLLLLYDTLITIRALEDSDLAMARVYANIMHNIPRYLLNDWNEETEKQMLMHMKARADVFGLWDQIQSWIEAEQSRLEDSSLSW